MDDVDVDLLHCIVEVAFHSKFLFPLNNKTLWNAAEM